MKSKSCLCLAVLWAAALVESAVAQPFGGTTVFRSLKFVEDPAVQRDRQWLHNYLADNPAYKSGTVAAQIDHMNAAQIRQLTRFYQQKHDLELQREEASEAAGYSAYPSSAPSLDHMAVLDDTAANMQRDVADYENQVDNLAEVRRWRFQIARQMAAVRPTFHADSYQPFIFNPLLYDYSVYYMGSSADGFEY